MGDKDNEYLKDVADQLKGMDESARKEAAEMAKKAEEMDKKLSGYRDNKKGILVLISVVAVCFALFHFYTGGFGMFTAIRQRAIHLAFALWICMMRYSSNKNAGPKVEPWLPHFFLWIMIMGTINIPLIDYARKARANMTVPVLVVAVICIVCAFLSRMITLKMRKKANKAVEDGPMWYDWLFLIASTAGCIYMAINTDKILQRAGIVYAIDQIMALYLLVGTIEATRRSIGKVLMWIGIFMLMYCRFGFLCGGIWNHPGFSFAMITRHFVLTDAALWGTPIGVSSSYISLFLLLGAALHATGLAELLLKVAKGLVGHFVGGPAKMAVVASSMFAMISGSSTSNVATTGVITIPLMKRTGIPAALAGATEASASMGGQVTPPVMGAVAFIMAEFLGISYISIITAAAIPALLYYVSVFTMIHFEAHKIGAWGLKKSEIDPTWKHDLLTKGYLILPVVMLVYMLVKGYTAMAACFYSFIVAEIVDEIGFRFAEERTMHAVRVGKAGKRALVDVDLANILVHRLFQRGGKINVLLILVHAIIFVDVELAVHDFLHQLAVGGVPVEVFPAITVAKPKEIAVFHKNHASSRFHVAIVGFLDEGSQLLAGLQVVADELGMVLFAVKVRDVDVFLVG